MCAMSRSDYCSDFCLSTVYRTADRTLYQSREPCTSIAHICGPQCPSVLLMLFSGVSARPDESRGARNYVGHYHRYC